MSIREGSSSAEPGAQFFNMNEAEMEISSHTSAHAEVRMQKTFVVTDSTSRP